uniref:Formin homology 2 domain containing 3a n=1 Tax=Pygocentrus nattereri TaxID=42514 RepID=A0AAR2M5I8_PYGNA
MASFVCRVQFLDDTDPFSSTSFPEPARPPRFSFREDLPLSSQLPALHRLLRAPHRLDDCALQLSHNGTYLDLEASLAEQRDEVEGFQQDDECGGGRGKKHSVILRTQLSVRVHACIEKLYNSAGRDLRRALFSLKQIFQDDKDLVHAFVMAEGLTCLIKVGAEADQNYQNYILRALGQIMLYVDGMNGVIDHPETIQWLYALIGSKFRLVVKTALKLLLVFVEYSESNAALLIKAINTVDFKRGRKQWSNAMEILSEKDGVDTELLVYTTSLINKTLAALPDQDSFYDLVDVLEEQGMQEVTRRYIGRKGTDLDLLEQLNLYEATLRHEDGDDEGQAPPTGGRDRRRSSVGGVEGRGLERRRSRRHSLGRMGSSTPLSPTSPHRTNFHPFNGEVSERSFSAAPSTPTKQQSDRPPLGGLLSSSYRQHQESLAAERERRRVEREERLQRIEREERNRHRFKTVERLAAEEYERDHVRLAPRSLTLSPTDICQSSDGDTPTSVTSQDDQDTSSHLPCEPEPDSQASPEPEQKEEELTEQEDEAEEEEEVEESSVDKEEGGPDERAGLVEEEEEELEQEAPDAEAEDSGILSDKERQNEEVNEKDNCSASSISSSSSTLEREERAHGNVAETSETGPSGQEGSASEQCSEILNSKLFMLDMLYSQGSKQRSQEEEEEAEEEAETEKEKEGERTVQEAGGEEEEKKKLEGGMVRAFAERFGDLVKGLSSPPMMEQESPEKQQQPPQAPPPPKKESDYIWDQLMASPRELRIGDIDFTDLVDEDDQDVLDSGDLIGNSNLPPPPPPPPCPFYLPPPPPPLAPGVRPPPPPPCFSAPTPPSPQLGRPEPPLFQKKKKTIRLFWSEVRPAEWQFLGHKRGHLSLWSKLEPVKLDTPKLEHLFESKSKEVPAAKKTAADGKRQEIIVLDSKRSNAINIGLTVLPPPRTIKSAILNFDEYALNKEGIEKILTMIPTEEEKQKIQEAQLANPDIPLGSAEQFLLTLSSISELSARLQLWAFKLDYEATEKEVAEPLQDLKEGMEQLEKNKTLRYVLSTLLAIGNFLNGSNAKGFDLSYLEKVPEVKDTVHKQSLLHHVCSAVVENFPESTDLYSEIGAVTRSAKVDFDQLQENLTQMERRCKASWENLKVIAKHEMKPVLKQKMSDFLKECAERIIILKIVHRRIINRFHSFLLYLGHPPYGVREISVHRFSKIMSEFALEYRTTRERILQQKQKRADHRERNKTRGKMIMDVAAPTDDEEENETGQTVGGSSSSSVGGSSTSAPSGGQSEVQGLSHAEDAAEHEHMKAVLKSSLQGGSTESSVLPGLRTRTRVRPSRGRTAWAAANEEGPGVTDDAADEIMERIVRSATQGPRERTQPRERRRSRANRKSLRRTLKNGLTAEEAQALGLEASEMQ